MDAEKNSETAKKALDAMRVVMLVLTLTNVLLVITHAWLLLLVLCLALEIVGLVFYRRLILENASQPTK